MKRTITVTGSGSVSVKPDLIVIELSLDAVDKNYEAAAELASQQIDSIRSAASEAGFAADELKTISFNIFTEYRSVPDENGIYHDEFTGFHCSHRIRLSFDFDTARLSRVLSTIGASSVTPGLNISFTVKEPAAVDEALLTSAAHNAAAKAEILCRASGVQLGHLISVNYDWNDHAFISNTRYGFDDCACEMASVKRSVFTAGITPDDIKVSDSASFVWELI